MRFTMLKRLNKYYIENREFKVQYLRSFLFFEHWQLIDTLLRQPVNLVTSNNQ